MRLTSKDIYKMRTYISNKYDTMSWKVKVSKMPVAQVIAIYRYFQKRDELLQKKEEDLNYHQIDMFEYLNERACNEN